MTDMTVEEEDAQNARSDADPLNEPPRATDVPDLRIEARREMDYLAGHWSERVAAFNEKDAGAATDQRSLWRDALRRFSRNRIAMVGMFVLTVFVLLAIFAPMFSDAKVENFTDTSRALERPNANAWFGTDPLGLDLWKMSWLGARISLSIAFAAALVILAIGVVYGSISGYVGGRVDNAMMRLLDALYGLPYLPFAIITATVIRQKWEGAPPIAFMVPALTLTTWFTSARIMRGQMLSLKQNEYIESARANGAPAGRIISKHVIPNALGVMVVSIFLEIPNAILGEAFLSFLGLGVKPPNTSWGQLAEQGYRFIDAAPHLMWVPALLIAVTVLATVAVADGVRDALDPRGAIH
ncbi:MAG: binding--dependent transport system inner rane component family protein [Thermoleophilia bacterium]|nr:binding--dependent transport system inner rane component family protein [Thermoleophilia bacterium]